MKKNIVTLIPLQKVGKCVQLGNKIEEKSKNAQSIDLMFFWNAIPDIVKAYEAYCDILNQVYSTKLNFIK